MAGQMDFLVFEGVVVAGGLEVCFRGSGDSSSESVRRPSISKALDSVESSSCLGGFGSHSLLSMRDRPSLISPRRA